MMNGSLPTYVFVEGHYDQLLLERHVVPRMPQSREVRIVQYKHLPKRELRKLIRGVARQGAVYAFLRDQDDFPCFPAARDRAHATYPNLDPLRIYVVVKSVEAWYLGGISQVGCTEIGINWNAVRGSTEHVHKRTLGSVRRPNCKLSSNEVLLASLDYFDLSRAKARNRSLRRLCRDLGAT